MNRNSTYQAARTDARAVINYALNVASLGYGSTSSVLEAVSDFADAMADDVGFEADAGWE